MKALSLILSARTAFSTPHNCSYQFEGSNSLLLMLKPLILFVWIILLDSLINNSLTLVICIINLIIVIIICILCNILNDFNVQINLRC